MPQAYSLMVGLTEVDESGPYYSRYFPEFDSRKGCEGCRIDVERMESLAHYIGFRPILGKHLLNENATHDNILAALKLVSDGSPILEAGDLFLFYLSCHGHSLGVVNPGSGGLFGGGINMFMVYDVPIINFELWESIISLIRRGIRVVTVIDSCHAGIGSKLIGFPSNDPRSGEFLLNLNREVAATKRTLSELSIMNLNNDSPPQFLNVVELGEQVDIFVKAIRKSVLPDNTEAGTDYPNPWGLVHFGASHDRGAAQGGVDGSLFTKRFVSLFCSGGNQLSYRAFAEMLLNIIRNEQIPQFETFPEQQTLESELVFDNY